MKENWHALSKKWHEAFGKFSPENLKVSNWDFDGIFCTKLKMYKLKIYMGVMCRDNEEWCKIGRGIDLSFQNWLQKIDNFWPRHSKVSEICTLTGSFWSKLKNYRAIMFDGTKDWRKIWRKTDLCFQIWHDESGKFVFRGLKIAISF